MIIQIEKENEKWKMKLRVPLRPPCLCGKINHGDIEFTEKRRE
jgi:hypothetical protein